MNHPQIWRKLLATFHHTRLIGVVLHSKPALPVPGIRNSRPMESAEVYPWKCEFYGLLRCFLANHASVNWWFLFHWNEKPINISLTVKKHVFWLVVYLSLWKKYEFVSWDYYAPYIYIYMKSHKHVPNHQPAVSSKTIPEPKTWTPDQWLDWLIRHWYDQTAYSNQGFINLWGLTSISITQNTSNIANLINLQ